MSFGEHRYGILSFGRYSQLSSKAVYNDMSTSRGRSFSWLQCWSGRGVFHVSHSVGCVNSISLWFKLAFPWWLMKMSIFFMFWTVSFVKYLFHVLCQLFYWVVLFPFHYSFIYLKMSTWLKKLTSYRPVCCIFFWGCSMYICVPHFPFSYQYTHRFTQQT